MADTPAGQSMVWYHAAALNFGLPTLLLGTHTLSLGTADGPRAGFSHAVSSRTTRAARNFCHTRQLLVNSLSLHGVPLTRRNEDATLALVHDGTVLAAVGALAARETSGEGSEPAVAELMELDEAQRQLAVRATQSVPQLFSALVMLGHRRDGTPAVRRIRPTLNLVPFGAEAPTLAHTVVERECTREGLAVGTATAQAQVHVMLNDVDAREVAHALPGACAERDVTCADITDTNGAARTQLSGEAEGIADVLGALMRPGLVPYPPTVAEVTPQHMGHAW